MPRIFICYGNQEEITGLPEDLEKLPQPARAGLILRYSPIQARESVTKDTVQQYLASNYSAENFDITMKISGDIYAYLPPGSASNDAEQLRHNDIVVITRPSPTDGRPFYGALLVIHVELTLRDVDLDPQTRQTLIHAFNFKGPRPTADIAQFIAFCLANDRRRPEFQVWCTSSYSCLRNNVSQDLRTLVEQGKCRRTTRGWYEASDPPNVAMIHSHWLELTERFIRLKPQENHDLPVPTPIGDQNELSRYRFKCSFAPSTTVRYPFVVNDTPQIATGTAGAFFYHKTNNCHYLLTAFHVVSGLETPSVSDLLASSFTFDTRPKNILSHDGLSLGTIEFIKFQQKPLLDLALIVIDDGSPVACLSPTSFEPCSSPVGKGQQVTKTGSKTGTTIGVIENINNYFVSIRDLYPAFSSEGDSGSLVYCRGAPVGILSFSDGEHDHVAKWKIVIDWVYAQFIEGEISFCHRECMAPKKNDYTDIYADWMTAALAAAPDLIVSAASTASAAAPAATVATSIVLAAAPALPDFTSTLVPALVDPASILVAATTADDDTTVSAAVPTDSSSECFTKSYEPSDDSSEDCFDRSLGEPLG